MEENKKKKSDAGKGDSPRPFSNYEKYLENWDEVFGHDDFEIEETPIRVTRVCNHQINPNSYTCNFCGKTTSDIMNDGESFYIKSEK